LKLETDNLSTPLSLSLPTARSHGIFRAMNDNIPSIYQGDSETRNVVDDLIHFCEEQGAPVCVGIDPQLDRIPHALYAAARMRLEAEMPEFTAEEVAGAAFVEFTMAVLEPLLEAGIRVFKPQIAHFERMAGVGILGYQGLTELLGEIGAFVIADVKRGDIGSTSEAYADGWLSGYQLPEHSYKGLGLTGDELAQVIETRGMGFNVDMITVNPYLGADSLEPFVTAAYANGSGLFALLKTSNPGSADLQDLELASGGKLYHAVGRMIEKLGADYIGDEGYSMVGAVVGATHPEQAAELRKMLPQTYFLVPGYGAQGAKASDLLPFFDKKGRGAIVNSSRGVIHCYDPADLNWKKKVYEAAKKLKEDIAKVAKKATK